jgi:membrane protein involved in colicin uptake
MKELPCRSAALRHLVKDIYRDPRGLRPDIRQGLRGALNVATECEIKEIHNRLLNEAPTKKKQSRNKPAGLARPEDAGKAKFYSPCRVAAARRAAEDERVRKEQEQKNREEKQHQLQIQREEKRQQQEARKAAREQARIQRQQEKEQEQLAWAERQAERAASKAKKVAEKEERAAKRAAAAASSQPAAKRLRTEPKNAKKCPSPASCSFQKQ